MSNEATEALKGNLLIVDDKPANLRLLATMLVEQGYKVRSAINGPLALTATQAAHPNMILLDINDADSWACAVVKSPLLTPR